MDKQSRDLVRRMERAGWVVSLTGNRPNVTRLTHPDGGVANVTHPSPELSPEHLHKVSLYMPHRMRERIQVAAERSGLTAAKWVNGIVNAALRKDESDDES